MIYQTETKMNNTKIKAANKIQFFESLRTLYPNKYIIANLATCKAISVVDGIIEEVEFENATPLESKTIALDIALCIGSGYRVFDSYRFFSLSIDSYKAEIITADFEF